MFDTKLIKLTYAEYKRNFNEINVVKFFLYLVPVIATINLIHVWLFLDEAIALPIIDIFSILCRAAIIFAVLYFCLPAQPIKIVGIAFGIVFLATLLRSIYWGIWTATTWTLNQAGIYSLVSFFDNIFYIISVPVLIAVPAIIIWTVQFVFSEEYIDSKKFLKILPEQILLLCLVVFPLALFGALYLWLSDYLFSMIAGRDIPISLYGQYTLYFIESPHHLIFKPLIYLSFFVAIKTFVECLPNSDVEN